MVRHAYGMYDTVLLEGRANTVYSLGIQLVTTVHVDGLLLRKERKGNKNRKHDVRKSHTEVH